MATVGGSSSSGLPRDEHGREITGTAVDVPTARLNSPDGTTARLNSTTDEVRNSSIQAAASASQNSPIQAPWTQEQENVQRVRCRGKQHERVDHRKALGDEPRLSTADLEMARAIDVEVECPADVPRMRGRVTEKKPGRAEVEKP